MTSSEHRCPTCNAPLPVVHGYKSWCECGWNLAPPARRDTADGRIDRLAASIGRRLGNRMAERLATAEELRPRPTPGRLAAYGIAVIVHALTLALAVGGLLLVVLPFPNIAGILGGAVMVGTAVLMRPRLGSLPDEGIVAPDEAPTLHAVVDEIATALDTPAVDVIAVDHLFNASWVTAGLRRRRVLTLGLPLLAGLEPQERVALIAHELAHGRNGDSARGQFVGSAVGGLTECYLLLMPGDDVEDGTLGPVQVLVNGVMWLLARPFLALLLIELHLLLRDSQRAEYLADALAADAAGTTAAIRLQEKLLLGSTVDAVVAQVARARDGEAEDLFTRLGETIARVPERERERRRRVARLEEARLSDTHPPTAKRIELLERRQAREARVLLSDERSGQIDAELRHLRARLQERLVDEHRDSLYA